MVRDVENLGPELNRPLFSKTEGLPKRHIEIPEVGPDQCIPAKIAALIGRRQLKRIDVPIAVRPSQNWIVRRPGLDARALIHGETRGVEIPGMVVAHAYSEGISRRQS